MILDLEIQKPILLSWWQLSSTSVLIQETTAKPDTLDFYFQIVCV